jgi:uncharacterized protein (DUF885 family)
LIFSLCDEYVTRYATVDPVYASGRGIVGDFGIATDYGPDGIAARADLVDDVLRRLDELTPTGPADTLAATHLRERLSAEQDWHRLGEPYRQVRATFGPLRAISENVQHVRPRVDEQDWQQVLARLNAIPQMLASWRAGLAIGLSQGLVGARRQALECALQADRYAGLDSSAPTHDALLVEYGNGPLADALTEATQAAYAGYAQTAEFLRGKYAPHATPADAVGDERHAVFRRLSLGADLDPLEAYEWGWAELHRIEAEMAHEAAGIGHRLGIGHDLTEVIAELDRTQSVTGPEAYQAWLQERHDEALEKLNGTHFDLAPGLRRLEVTLLPSAGASGIYYTPPSEDLVRPGRTWWALGGREKFAVWGEATTVFHEGVPGHHLQIGQTVLADGQLSRFSRTFGISGHSEGWALYAERLADELGWHTQPGWRLGMLKAGALRAARVVIDLGLHLGLPIPADEVDRYGSVWTFEVATEVLAGRGRCAPHRVHPEVVRYCGWPAQATAYKLGERAWLAAREEARARLGRDFNLKRWHTAALNLGPIGLGHLTDALRGIQ